MKKNRFFVVLIDNGSFHENYSNIVILRTSDFQTRGNLEIPSSLPERAGYYSYDKYEYEDRNSGLAVIHVYAVTRNIKRAEKALNSAKKNFDAKRKRLELKYLVREGD